MHGNGAHYTYVKHVSNCTNDVYYEGVRNLNTTHRILPPSISEPDCLFLTDLFAFGKKSGAEKNFRFELQKS